MVMTRAISNIEEIYHPMIVIGCATENETRRAILRSRDMLDIRARTRETALMAMSLKLVQDGEISM